MRRIVPVWGLVVVSLAGYSHVERFPTPRIARSAVFLTMDTFRGGFFGAGGDPSVRTPHLDRFFRQGTQFSRAFSASPATLPAHVSLLTGLWPTTHGVPRNLFRVPDDLVTVAEVLKERGFATAAFVSSAVLDPRFNLSQGFDVYNFRATDFVRNEQSWRPAPRTLHRAVTWYRNTTGRRFLWVHVFEPHAPYEPPAVDATLYAGDYHGSLTGSMDDVLTVWGERSVSEEDRRHLVGLYRGEIAALDRYLGPFFEAMEDDPSVAVVVTSDHGESLGEHGLYFKHGDNTFPADVRVPLGVRGGAFVPSVSSAIVATRDVAKTLLTLLGVDGKLSADAPDLTPWIHGGRGETVFGLAVAPWEESVRNGFMNGRMMRVARDADFAYVESPWQKWSAWFDRRSDPAEIRPIREPMPEGVRRLHASVSRWIGQARRAPDFVDDPRLREKLESLGYVN